MKRARHGHFPADRVTPQGAVHLEDGNQSVAPTRRAASAGALAALAASLLASGCGPAAGDAGSGEDVPRTLVRAIDVGTGPVERVERSIGRVETFSAPEVAPEVEGRITEVLVDVGDSVEQGDVLARLEREPFELQLGATSADRGRLEVERAQWERDLQRMESVADEGYVSDSELENARAELSAIDAELESVRYLEQQAEADLRRTEIVSPIAGEVDSRWVSEGDYVSTGARAFRVTPLAAYRVRLNFPQGLREVLDVGQAVRLHPSDSPDEQGQGVITRIRPTVGGGSRSLIAVVDFDDPGGWRPGMTVTGEVVLDSNAEAVRIPRLSVVQRPAGRVVYVVEGDTVAQREIRIGHQSADWVEVTDGLDAGERIVTDGAQFLTDGAAIRLQEGEP